MSTSALPRRDFTSGALPVIGMLVAVTAWGLGNILAKKVSVDGLTLSFYRLWFGGILTLAILVVARHRPTRRELALSAPAGAVFGVNMVLGFTALKITTVADATLIGALQPALVLLVAGSWFGERIGLPQIVWTGVSIAGIAILIAGASSSPEWSLFGDTLAATGVLLFTGYFLASKRIRETVATVAFMFGTHVGAAAVVTPIALVHGLHPSDLSTADLARILTLVCTSGVTAHMLINWAHPYVKVSLSSVLVLLTPVVASLGAWVALHESLNGIQLVGGAVTLVAIAAITRTSSAEKVEAQLLEIPEPVT